MPNQFEKSTKSLEINGIGSGLFQGLDTKKEKNIFFVENKKNIDKGSVLISEIIIEGWENHPEGRKTGISCV